MSNGYPNSSGTRRIATRATAFRTVWAWLVALSFSAEAADLSDDFSGGVGSWVSSPGWVLVEQASGQYVYRGDSTGDTFAQNGLLNLGSSWRLEIDVRFRRYYADNKVRGLAAFALFPSLGSGVQFEANLGHRTNSSVQVDNQWFNPANGSWSNVLQVDWIPNSSPAYRMHLFRAAGSDRLVFKVTSTNGFAYRGETVAIPLDVLNRMKVFGLRVNSSQVEFGNLRVITPYTPPAPPTITAQPQDQTATTGSTVTFRVTAAGTGSLTYQWLRGKARLTTATNASYTIKNVLPAHAASFSVVVSNGETTATSDAAALKVIDAYVRPAAFAKTNGIGMDGLALELTAPTGTGYVLQQSLDLTNWTDLTNSVGEGMAAEFVVSGVTNQPHGFYRLLLP